MFSPMSLENMVATYGYAAILIGTLLEGETILVIGGFLAHRGYMQLPWVIAAAFIGTFVGDQLFFYWGRKKGAQAIERRSGWKAKSEKIFRMLQKHQIAVMLGFRFLYGFRTITPFVIGVSGVHPLRFLAFNLISASAWSLCIGILGYFLGHTLEIFLEEAKRYELWIMGGIAGIGLIFWAVHLWKRQIENR